MPVACDASLPQKMAAFREQRRASAHVHEELNKTVQGFITKDRSLNDVTVALHKGKELLGKNDGLVHGAVDNAVATIKEVLTFRLQEAAVDAIITGKRKGQSKVKVNNFSKSLVDIEASGYLEGEVDFGDFRHLLENLQGKLEGERGKVTDKIPWLLEQLKTGTDRNTYSEATLASLASNLLREMRNNTKVSQKFLQLGGVDAFELVLCGDKEAKVQLPTPYHPELQVILCLILAEVVLLGDAEVAKKRGQRKMAMSFFTSKGDKNSRMGMLAKMTRHNAKSEQAVELLFKVLDGATRRREHALVWGVLSGLAELVPSTSCCQQLFSSGFIPLLHRVLEVYSAHPQPLPTSLPRLDERSRAVTLQAPPFISTLKPSAIQKNPETLKEWWLKKSTSLPTLTNSEASASGFSDRRRSSLAWLSVARSSKEGSDCHRIFEMAHSKKDGQRHDWHEDPNFKVPNLMWLLAEDGATEHSHVRACDRNFVVLKVKRLLLNMEKERSKMASILRGAAHRPPSRAPSQA